MKKRIVVCLTLLVAILGTSLATANPVSAAPSSGSKYSPMVALDCGIYVGDPYKVGDYVWGDAMISCATSHPVLTIVAGIADRIPPNTDVNRYNPSSSKTCRNTTSCTVSAKLSYVPLRQWRTDGSAYQGNYWDAYLQSDWVAVNP